MILLLSVLFIIGMDLHNSEKHSIINHRSSFEVPSRKTVQRCDRRVIHYP